MASQGEPPAPGRPALPLRWPWLPESASWRGAAVAGLGGFIAIFTLAELTSALSTVLLIAPFGASCVLVFALPQSPLAQPRNVIGGHLVSTLVGLLVLSALGPTQLAFGLAVGFAIIIMQLTAKLHPPAGADPIVVILAGASFSCLLVPVAVGACMIVGWAIVFHRFVSRRPYPL